jgi:hypothetical protein
VDRHCEPNGRAASGVWSVSEPIFPFDFAKNSNLSSKAPAQFQRILRRSQTIVKLQMDEILRFWAEVACENIQSSGVNLTRRQLLAQILREYEKRGDAQRCLDSKGKIVWKASPRFLTMLADAERDAEDDLADFP